MKPCYCCRNKHTEAGKSCPDCRTYLGECDWHGTEQDLEELGLINLTLIFTPEEERV